MDTSPNLGSTERERRVGCGGVPLEPCTGRELNSGEVGARGGSWLGGPFACPGWVLGLTAESLLLRGGGTGGPRLLTGETGRAATVSCSGAGEPESELPADLCSLAFSTPSVTSAASLGTSMSVPSRQMSVPTGTTTPPEPPSTSLVVVELTGAAGLGVSLAEPPDVSSLACLSLGLRLGTGGTRNDGGRPTGGLFPLPLLFCL